MVDWAMLTTVEQVMPDRCCCKGKGFVSVPAPPGHPLFGKAIPCACRRDYMARERALRMVQRSGTTEEDLTACTFDRFHLELCVAKGGGRLANGDRQAMENLVEICRAYASTPRGWLVLVGETGSGKTHLAKAIVNVFLARGEQAYVSTVSRMLDVLRSGYEDGNYREYQRGLEEVSLLVLDDLGSERATDWTRETLLGVVDSRLRARLPMIATMNVLPNDAGMEKRLGSRLAEGAGAPDGWSRVVVMPCGDARQKLTWKERKNERAT